MVPTMAGKPRSEAGSLAVSKTRIGDQRMLDGEVRVVVVV